MNNERKSRVNAERDDEAEWPPWLPVDSEAGGMVLYFGDGQQTWRLCSRSGGPGHMGGLGTGSLVDDLRATVDTGSHR